MREETRCRHMGYSFRLTAPSHRQDSTYHGLCYTSRGALAGTGNSSMGRVMKLNRGGTDPTTMSGRSILVYKRSNHLLTVSPHPASARVMKLNRGRYNGFWAAPADTLTSTSPSCEVTDSCDSVFRTFSKSSRAADMQGRSNRVWKI